MRFRPFASGLSLASILLLVACSDREPAAPLATPAGPAVSATTASASGAGAAPPTSAPRPTLSPTPAAASGSANFEASQALVHVQQLAGVIGVRLSGTPAEQEAARYLRGALEASGYAVDIVEFRFDDRAFRTADVTIDGTTTPGLTMTGSAVAQVSGAAVFVGLADAVGLAGKDLRGRIAVADRGTLLFAEKADAVRELGAAGLIVINNEDGDLSGQLASNIDIPVAGISREGAVALRRAASTGATVTLKTTRNEERVGLNVVARPKVGAGCKIVVGGHHDTVPGAPGAHDNASGTATVVELARALAADGLDDGLCFVTFGAEESGLFGSANFVESLERQGGLPAFMINIDQMGRGTRVDLIGTPALTRQAASVAERLGILAQATTLGAQYGSDHQSFQTAGVPVLFFTSNDLGKFHTPEDKVGEVQPEMVQRTGDVAIAVIRELLREVGP